MKSDIGDWSHDAGIQAVMQICVGKGFKLRHITECDGGFPLNEAFKNGFAYPSFVAELYHNRIALEFLYQFCKIDPVL